MTRAMTIAESLFFIFFTPHFQTINLRCETGSVAGAVTSLSSDHHKDEYSAALSGRQRPTGAAIQDSLPPRQRRLLRKSFRSAAGSLRPPCLSARAARISPSARHRHSRYGPRPQSVLAPIMTCVLNAESRRPQYPCRLRRTCYEQRFRPVFSRLGGHLYRT